MKRFVQKFSGWKVRVRELVNSIGEGLDVPLKEVEGEEDNDKEKSKITEKTNATTNVKTGKNNKNKIERNTTKPGNAAEQVLQAETTEQAPKKKTKKKNDDKKEPES